GTAPLAEPVLVDPGSRQFEARKIGYTPVQTVTSIASGTATDVELKLSAPPVIRPAPTAPKDAVDKKTRQMLIYTGSAVSGGLALTGILAAIGAEAVKPSVAEWKENKCTQANPQCRKDWDNAGERQVFLKNTAFWTLIGAAAVGGTTLVGAYVTRPHSPTAPQ